MHEALIVAATRTAVGKAPAGSLRTVRPDEMAAAAISEVLKRAPGVEPADIDDVVLGCAMPEGEQGLNVARIASLRAGVPVEASAVTVNRFCSSGLQSIAYAAERIMCGFGRAAIAGGTESMSRVPYLLDRARFGYRLGSTELVDAMYRDGFLCPLCERVMGETAETLADRYAIPREEQDEFAAESQRRCEAARRAGRFVEEIVPVEVPDAKGRANRIEADEHPRDGVTAASLAKLPPVFRKDGTVHAGNSSGITDGAASLLVLSEAATRRSGIRPLARIAGYATAGVDPAIMGIGPVPAIRRLEERTGVRLGEIDLVELNEAFAAQVLACDRELRFDRSRLNVNGGAIALGHPIGATGARIVVTLLQEMVRRGARRGLATLCVSGGLGFALLLESV